MKRKEEVQSELHFLWLRQFFLFFNFTIHCIKTSRAFPLPWFYGRKGYISVQIMSFSFGKKKKKLFRISYSHYGGVWFVFLNNYFQFLNNISRISTHFFTHTYFHKCFQTTIFSF